jgi:hypothetical protein
MKVLVTWAAGVVGTSNPEKAKREYDVRLAVGHNDYRDMPPEHLLAKLQPRGCLVDVKALLERERFSARDASSSYWRL